MRSIARLIGGAALCVIAGSAGAADTVRVGLGGTIADASFYIAQDRGYFGAEGIDAKFIIFASGAKEIAPLGTGEIEVGSGALSVGFYNAIARGFGIRIVADKAHTAPGYFYQSVFIRNDLIDAGAFKTLKDLNGLRMAFAAVGVTPLSVLNEAAKRGGIAFSDTRQVYLSFPEQVAGFANKAIDGCIMIEPQATVLSAKGIGTRFMNTEKFYPHDEITLVFYGEKFAAGQPATAEKFLKAYLRGARDYSDAIKAGRLAGPGAAGVIKIMAENFHLDADLIAQMYAPAVDPDGAVNLASLQKDLDFFRDQKMMTEPIDLAKVVDLSFAKKASAALGPYRAKGR